MRVHVILLSSCITCNKRVTSLLVYILLNRSKSVEPSNTMAANLQFVPGRKKDTENPILNGFRYVLDKRRDDTFYWKCSDFRNGCRARITTTDKQLTSPIPSHSHEVQNAETTVHKAKQNLKRKAADGDQPTKYSKRILVLDTNLP